MSTLTVILAVSLGLAAQPAAESSFYIAPTGNDTWSGRLAEPKTDGADGPFATLERARDEIKTLQKIASLRSGPITVYLRGGDYVRDKAFELTAADSGSETAPITYRAFKNEKVRLLGGRKVASFQPVTDQSILDRLDPAARGKVVQADLKAAGVKDFGDVVAAGKRFEVFFQDRPMTLARWPNEGFVKIIDVVGGEPETVHGLKGDKVGKFTYEGDRPKRWTAENDIRLQGYWFWDWADAYQQVQSIDTDKRVIALAPPYHVYGYRAGQRFYALNLLAELDSPGEWYLDRKGGRLYFWPPADVASSEVFVSLLDSMISMKDASFVTLRGLTIEFNRGTAIAIAGGSHDRVAACTLRNVGGQAVVVTGGSDHTVVGCDIDNTGNGGISLEGGDRKTLKPAGHAAINNHIHHYSRTNNTYRTAVSVAGVGCRVANNLIHDAPHMALGLSGNEHVIEFNEVYTVCMETDDAGAFYMGRDWTWRGNIIRYNYFHDIGQFKSHVGCQAIYLDDWASGTTVFGNICSKVYRAILVGGGRNNTVENNVLVDCPIGIHVDSRGLGWAKYYFDGKENTLVTTLNAMPYKDPPWSTRYPELLTLYHDEPALAKYDKVVRNVATGCAKWLDLHDGLTDKIVEVKDNLTGADPRFVDPAGHNFRLKDDSPAWKLGFQRIPVEKIGLYPDELRASTPAGK